jgi:hypothetical protein
MMRIVDGDRSGSIGFREFRQFATLCVAEKQEEERLHARDVTAGAVNVWHHSLGGGHAGDTGSGAGSGAFKKAVHSASEVVNPLAPNKGTSKKESKTGAVKEVELVAKDNRAAI